MMEQSSRRNMQLQQDRLQQLQQGQMRAWRQPASASPKSRRGASPAPYVPGHRRHRVFVLLLVATGLVAAISVGSAVAAGSDAPHIPGLPGGSAPVEGTSTVVLRVWSEAMPISAVLRPCAQPPGGRPDPTPVHRQAPNHRPPFGWSEHGVHNAPGLHDRPDGG
jgi:hypothetical protein